MTAETVTVLPPVASPAMTPMAASRVSSARRSACVRVARLFEPGGLVLPGERLQLSPEPQVDRAPHHHRVTETHVPPSRPGEASRSCGGASPDLVVTDLVA